MLQEERLEDIRKKVIQEKKVLVNELVKEYGVSDVTIRKDLQILTKEKLIKKIHGGALLNESRENNFKNLLEEQDLEKDKVKSKIIKIALNQIKEGDTIFLGSGRTCSLLAKELKNFKQLTVVTNNLSAVMDLLNSSCKLYIVGGEVTTTDSRTYFSSIENASQYLKSIFVSKAFTSCSGLDLNAGITVNSIISTYIYKNLSDINRSWYLMIDEEKFDKMGIYKVAELNQINCVIANKIPEKYKKYFNENKIKHLSE
jgi:DeoR family fructose operon transcriptional repressor